MRPSKALRMGVHGRGHVAVEVEWDPAVGMAEHLGDDLGVHVLFEQQRGRRVAHVVEADPVDWELAD